MAVNVVVQYNVGFSPDILLLTQAPICVWFDGTVTVYCYYPLNYVLQQCLCMAIEISVQYNVGLLPDIILLTQRLLPSGNPFKYHVEVLSLQLLFCFCFLFGVLAWRSM